MNNHTKQSIRLLFAILIPLLLSCERDWDNPWDGLETSDTSRWTPTELEVVGSNNENEIYLRWETFSRIPTRYDIERRNIDTDEKVTFHLDHSAGTDLLVEWTNDKDIDLQKHRYSYRIRACLELETETLCSPFSDILEVALARIDSANVQAINDSLIVYVRVIEGSDDITKIGLLYRSNQNGTGGEYYGNWESANSGYRFRVAISDLENMVAGNTYNLIFFVKNKVGKYFFDDDDNNTITPKKNHLLPQLIEQNKSGIDTHQELIHHIQGFKTQTESPGPAANRYRS